jgi:hypothetical protein
MSLLGVNPAPEPDREPEPRCEGAGPHPITCRCVAARTAHAMVDGDGDVFYPDSLDDARYFDRHYGARPLNPQKFNEWFGVEVPPVERCGPECSEQHTYTGACVLAPAGRVPGPGGGP